MKIRLVVAQGPRQGQVIPVTRSSFLIGRNEQCQLRAKSASISDFHCVLLIRDGKVVLRDLSGTPGTLVNHQTLHGERPLNDGDHVAVGPLAFQVRIDSKPIVQTAEVPIPADLNRDGDVLVARTPEAVDSTDADQEAAKILLEEDSTLASPSAETGEITLRSADTATLPATPASSSLAAQEILEQYRLRRNKTRSPAKR